MADMGSAKVSHKVVYEVFKRSLCRVCRAGSGRAQALNTRSGPRVARILSPSGNPTEIVLLG